MPHRSAARVLFALLILLAPARALAFLFVAGPDDSLTIPAQRAIITWKDGEEGVSVEFEYSGVHGPFGWIVPLPSSADAGEEEGRSLRSELSCCCPPRIAMAIHDLDVSYGCLGPRYEGYRTPVTVDSVLPSAAGVCRWVARNRWKLPPNMEACLERYEDSGYVFSVLRVEHGVSAVVPVDTGTVHCTRFRFGASAPEFVLGDPASLGGPSDVHAHLLTADQYVLSDQGSRVDFSLYGPQRLPRVARGYYDDKTRPMPLLSTHFRGTVSPNDAPALSFDPYDPYPELRCENMIRRAQATSYLGRTRPSGTADSLIAFLDRRGGVDEDVYSALWALGEIGGARAESVLAAGTKHENTLYRRSCMEGLAKTRTPGRLRLYIEGMAREDPEDPVRNLGVDEERTACYEHLLAEGGPADLPLLRLVAEHYMGALAWVTDEFPQGPWIWLLCRSADETNWVIGARAEAALAVLGDSAAYSVIREKISEQAVVMAEDSVSERVKAFSGRSRIAQWANEGSHPKPLESSIRRWTSFENSRELYKTCPGFRDDLYRDLISDDRIPTYGKIVLLGWLDAPTPKDLALLRSLEEQALEEERWAETTDRDSIVHPVNPKLWAVARSMVQLEWAEGMIDLVKALPDSDDVVRMMLLEAIRRPSREDDLEYFVRYVRSEWDGCAAKPDYARDLLESVDAGFPPPEKRELGNALADRLVKGCEWTSVISILEDPEIHPYHKLFWVSRLAGHIAYEEGRIGPAAARAFDELVARSGDDPVLARGVERIRKSIEEKEVQRRELEARFPR